MSDIWDMQFGHEYSFLWISELKMSCLDYLEMEFRFQKSMGAKHLCDVNFNDWSKKCFSRNGCISSGLWV